ncbi:hypothetical protein GLAREA_02920 [Glarea lozoyensis ATCC 20868]|uniref:Heterokaryon incompatibility domain-containing protein n=1 Tax=Glarea lozoyensis (strain ATCC 20868 / MF5171) TaxID=1116229 RepID=S3D4K3_GLAL2|nr:uncharacterized protein GLAREA_02920 [Glarea lozoyensis ATCC 20868]EPE27006.1 hypothetical protein GLAREA_02920 [Glarea lozoyensis ATCC 20868]
MERSSLEEEPVVAPVSFAILPETEESESILMHDKRIKEGTSTVQETIYSYEPIDANHLRILTISPGLVGQKLNCSLSVWVRGSPEKYDALSYVWGEEQPSERLPIGFEGESFQYLMVTKNLLSILNNLRSTTSPRRIWIDALCINQEDFEEKNTQVPMMSRTYGDAACVRIWLGQEEHHSSRAMALIQKIPLSVGRFERFIALETRLEDWFALSMVMRRRWFTRRWVLQEIAMASEATIYCGDQEASWSNFVSATQLFQMYSEDISKKFEGWNYFDARNYSASRLIAATTNFVRRDDKGRITRRCKTLEELICDLTTFEATRPHDVLYAVISLADDGPRSSFRTRGSSNSSGAYNQVISTANGVLSSEELLRIRKLIKPVLRKLNTIRAREELFSVSHDAFKVSYQKPFAHVAAGFMERITTNSLSLDMIFRPWAPENEELPTWIRTLKDMPWRTKEEAHHEHLLMHEGSTLIWRRLNADPLVAATPAIHTLYKASGKPPSRPTWAFHQINICESSVPILYARGFVLDVILQQEEPATLGRVPVSWLKYGNETIQHDEFTSEWRIPDDFWRTMIANRDRFGSNPPPFYSTVCGNVFYERKEGGHVDIISEREKKLDMIQHEFLQRVEAVVLNRRLTRTKQHAFLSLVPRKTQPGDLVCIINGCSVPVVLSKRTKYGDNQGYYSLVGESYVHGMMEGEAFDLKSSNHGVPWETFRIV